MCGKLRVVTRYSPCCRRIITSQIPNVTASLCARLWTWRATTGVWWCSEFLQRDRKPALATSNAWAMRSIRVASRCSRCGDSPKSRRWRWPKNMPGRIFTTGMPECFFGASRRFWKICEVICRKPGKRWNRWPRTSVKVRIRRSSKLFILRWKIFRSTMPSWNPPLTSQASREFS